MASERVMLFVCAHGAGKSRMAAALFNAAGPAGWRATSAGQEPGESVSPLAVRLLEGTPAEEHLDKERPREIGQVSGVSRTVGIDCDVEGAERWDLRSAPGQAMRDEIGERVDKLLSALPGAN